MGAGNAEIQAQSECWVQGVIEHGHCDFSASFWVVHKEGRVILSEKLIPPPPTWWILLFVDNAQRRASAEICFCLKPVELWFSQQICFPRALGVKRRGKSPCLLTFLFCHTVLVLNAPQHLFFESGSWFLELFSHSDLNYKSKKKRTTTLFVRARLSLNSTPIAECPIFGGIHVKDT